MNIADLNQRLKQIELTGPLGSLVLEAYAVHGTDSDGVPCAEIHVRVLDRDQRVLLGFVPRWAKRPFADFDNEAKLKETLMTIAFDAMGRLVYQHFHINGVAEFIGALKYLDGPHKA